MISKYRRRKLYIYPKITEEEFVKKVKENPFCIHKDIKVIRSLYVLETCCLSRNTKISDTAKNILSKVGLEAFIPKGSKKRKSTDVNLKRIGPRKIYFSIKSYEYELKTTLDKRYSSKQIDKKKRDIKRVYKNLFNVDPSESDLVMFCKLEGKRNIAIMFFCSVHNIKHRYESVRVKYHELIKNNIKENLMSEVPRLFIDLQHLKYFIKNKYYSKMFLYYKNIP